MKRNSESTVASATATADEAVTLKSGTSLKALVAGARAVTKPTPLPTVVDTTITVTTEERTDETLDVAALDSEQEQVQVVQHMESTVPVEPVVQVTETVVQVTEPVVQVAQPEVVLPPPVTIQAAAVAAKAARQPIHTTVGGILYATALVAASMMVVFTIPSVYRQVWGQKGPTVEEIRHQEVMADLATVKMQLKAANEKLIAMAPPESSAGALASTETVVKQPTWLWRWTVGWFKKADTTVVTVE